VFLGSGASMDLVNSLGNSHLGFEEEAENIHFRREDVENNDDENHPSRPVSRLDFNPPASSAGSPKCHETDNSEVVQWSRSLFQSIGISDLRLSTLKTHSGNAPESGALRSTHSTPDVGERSISNVSSNEQAFESPYGNAVEDMAKYATVGRKSSTSPLPVSRLSFPFVTTPSPHRNKTPLSLRPSRRHKYSCFPSSMSPEPAARPSPSHQRHSYRQHGYSRLALQHLKWFWSIREREWGEASNDSSSNPDLRNIDVYNSASPDAPHVQPVNFPFNINRVPTPYAHRTIPTTIHPRRGDISALRDPYSFQIDRCFAGLANWTFGKILWMLDVHAAMEKRKMEVDVEQDVSDEESESELETSASTGFSDDSDCTLVESENESDSRDTILDTITIYNVAELPQILSVGYLDNTSWSHSLYTHTSKSRKLDREDMPWATNWYRRWALLVDISRGGNKDRKHLVFEPVTPIDFIPTVKDDTGPHFTFAGKHKYLANDELSISKLGNSNL
jgi:hypothetical protein